MRETGGAVTDEEITAIRFYYGDPQTVKDGPYRGGPEAYNTINALLHPGFANELDKAAEGRCFGLEDTSQLRSYMDLIQRIFSVMIKYSRGRKDILAHGWRVDRISSWQRFLDEGGVIRGFFSTCKYGLMPEYAHKKEGAVLLEVSGRDLPWLDLGDLLGGSYAKPQEAEILFPFGTRILDCEAQEITGEEARRYTDLRGDPPAGKFGVTLGRGRYDRKAVAGGFASRRQMYEYISCEDSCARAAACMRRLQVGKAPAGEEAKFYRRWKECLITYTEAAAGDLLARAQELQGAGEPREGRMENALHSDNDKRET